MNRVRKIDQMRNKINKSLKINSNLNQGITQEEYEQRIELEKQHIFYIKGNIEEYFTEKEILGEGCVGLVRKVIKIKDNQVFASKMVKTNDEEQINNIIKEFKFCSKLNHQNIVKVYELYIDPVRGRIYTIMELVEAKEMFQVIQQLGSYSEAVASLIFKQILSAILYLHENMICHRDLKPNNILTSQDGQCVKITDFNVSKFGENKRKKFNKNIKMWTYTGTVAFSAPEIFQSGEYNEAVDMWSAGIVLYTMLSGKMPFEAEYLQDLIEKIKIGEYEFPEEIWGNISKNAIDLIQCCLQKDPKDRIMPDKALLHPWITQRQNTSPLSTINQQNLKDNSKKFLTKFTAYNSLGLVKNINRKKTIAFSLFEESPILTELNKMKLTQLKEDEEDTDESFKLKLIQLNQQQNSEENNLTNPNEEKKSFDSDDKSISSDDSSNIDNICPYKTVNEFKDIEDTDLMQQNQLQNALQKQRRFQSNIIDDRYQFSEKLQFLIQNEQSKELQKQKNIIQARISPIKLKSDDPNYQGNNLNQENDEQQKRQQKTQSETKRKSKTINLGQQQFKSNINNNNANNILN